MSFEENEIFTVHWKIKNFSYCWANIRSPDFTYHGEQWCLELEPKILNCNISYPGPERPRFIFSQISFLTCDGSPEESMPKRFDIQNRFPNFSFSVSKDMIFGQRRSAFLPKDTLTIRCRLFHSCRPSGGNFYVRSQIGVKRLNILWTLKDFSQQSRDEKLYVENSDQCGNIQLNLKSVGGINSDEQFYIQISREGGESCYCVLKVSVLDNEGKAVNCVSDEFIFEKENLQQFWRFPPVIRNSKLLACKTLLLPNGALSLKCDFAITLGKVTDQTAVYSYYEGIAPFFKDLQGSFKDGSLSNSITDLKNDLKSILDNGTLCDVNLQVGSDIIQAHQIILSARSPVFQAMFTKDMKEKIKTVDIEDSDVDTIRGLIIYMYTDALHDCQWEKIVKLYYVADKYEVLGLKQKCSSFLNANLSFSNVCEVLVLSDKHQDQDLLSTVYDFISKYDTEVFASESWRELEENYSALAFKTLREVCSNKRLDGSKLKI